MIEPMTAGVSEKWLISKEKATGLMCLIGFCISIVFATGSGLHWLDIVDHFIANFGLVVVGLAECLILGWFYRLSTLRDHANATSEITIGRWWDVLIKFVIPFILVLLLTVALINTVIIPYLGHPWWVLALGGALPCVGIVVLSVILMKTKQRRRKE